tara:strand:+ start:626 stop:1384 length:759 start_codon:yes stop_codon:yes gene_type:complete
MIEILILSFVQGITEFLPISSSSHLILLSNLIGFDEKSLSIDISMHIGSFLAVITYFYKDFINLIENINLFTKILISSIPVMIVGFFAIQTGLIEKLRNIEVIGWMTLTFGVLLYFSDKFKLEKNINKDFNYKSALLIGLFQILSLIPGVSRSGITITAARLLNFNRVDSAKISFLLSVPTLGAVSIYGFKDLIVSEDINFSFLNLICIILSFLFSLITIKYFLKYIKRFSLNIFVIYRIVLAMVIFYYAYL